MRLVFVTILMFCWQAVAAAPVESAGSTVEQRLVLFDSLVEKIMSREAFSDVKNDALGLSFPDALLVHRQRFADAGTDEALYWALVALSNARKDRHLDVEPVAGGLRIPTSYNAFDPNDFPGISIDPDADPTAPVRFLAGFGDATPVYFVAELSTALDPKLARRMSPGDIVAGINGMAIEDFIAEQKVYWPYSTLPNFYVRTALALNLKTAKLPRWLYRDQLELELLRDDGSKYSVSIPYLPEELVSFESDREDRYPGFERALDFTSFDLYRPLNDERLLILDWYGFRDDLVTATDALIAYAESESLLEFDIVVDATRSRGGGRGAYAVQRLQALPFRTTFGNLRLSDLAADFVQSRIDAFDAGQVMSDGTRETVGSGSWLMDWFKDDVAKGFAAGQAYSNNVPFKLAHAPKWSDGVLKPARTHFSGRMICWFGPYGGSHLDQFAAIVADNDLCHRMGMPTGGYSNTWEAVDTLRWSHNGQPIADFMFSIGHTIRPNGEILEGNPPAVDDSVPLTRKNYLRYRALLLERSRRLLSDPGWRHTPESAANPSQP